MLIDEIGKDLKRVTEERKPYGTKLSDREIFELKALGYYLKVPSNRVLGALISKAYLEKFNETKG